MQNNNFHISIPVSGLIRREDYKYEILGLGGNWPSVASPSSGSFISYGRSTNINTTISFLPTTGTYSNLNILPYNLLSCGYNDSELFTNVMAKVTSLSDNNIVFSPTQLIKCSGCLPKISINMTACGLSENCSQYTLTTGNIFDFVSSFSGLEPNTPYTYTINSLGANWPVVVITPISGSFTPNDTTYSLEHKLAFCPYSGNACGSSNNILSHNLAQCFIKNNLYSNIELSISPNYCNNERVFSNNILLNCKNCLPKISSSLSPKISLSSSNIANISGVFAGLVPNTLYNYSFNCLDSNWPSILQPLSGSFIATSTSETISSQLMFCSPSGNCSGNQVGLLPYTLDNQAEKDFYQDKLRTILVLNLTSECGDNSSSKECVIECNNCLPCVRYANAIFSSSPVITLDGGCCVGQKLLTVNISNSIPGNKYTYKFSTPSGVGVNNITFNPISGEMYFGGDGAGDINTICNVDLINNTKTLINFELTHSLTDTKVIDSVILSCTDGSC